MNEVAVDIDFADSVFNSCEIENGKLVVYLNGWDDKTIKIVFENTIEFIYKAGSSPTGIFEKSDESFFLNEALSQHYEQIPQAHPFKVFAIIDIEDCAFLKVVAEGAHVTKVSRKQN